MQLKIDGNPENSNLSHIIHFYPQKPINLKMVFQGSQIWHIRVPISFKDNIIDFYNHLKIIVKCPTSTTLVSISLGDFVKPNGIFDELGTNRNLLS